MSVHRIIREAAFGPEDIARLTIAYEVALCELDLSDRTDPITEIVAKKIIAIALTGERDPARICAAALQKLRSDSAI